MPPPRTIGRFIGFGVSALVSKGSGYTSQYGETQLAIDSIAAPQMAVPLAAMIAKQLLPKLFHRLQSGNDMVVGHAPYELAANANMRKCARHRRMRRWRLTRFRIQKESVIWT